MNSSEFEQAVREMRCAQRRFFATPKDSPDKAMVKRMMQEREKEVLAVVEPVMAIRPVGKRAESDREQFFLDVAEMMRLQRQWVAMGGGGSWMMNPAREAEKKVSNWLAKFDEEHKAEEQRRIKELKKNQLKLFEDGFEDHIGH